MYQIPDGFVLWLTGLPASGKSMLAQVLHAKLTEQGICTSILDSDMLRVILTPEPDYTPQERNWFYITLTSLAALLAHSGVNVIIAATGNRRTYREAARLRITRFAEVYVVCPLEICQQRDPKGIYAQSRAGEADRVPGIGVPYEPPLLPEVIVDTGQLTPVEAAQVVLTELHTFLIPKNGPARVLQTWQATWPEVRGQLEELIIEQARHDPQFYAYHAEWSMREFERVLHQITRLAEHLHTHTAALAPD